MSPNVPLRQTGARASSPPFGIVGPGQELRSDVSLRRLGFWFCHSERSRGISNLVWTLELDGLKPSSSGRAISVSSDGPKSWLFPNRRGRLRWITPLCSPFLTGSSDGQIADAGVFLDWAPESRFRICCRAEGIRYRQRHDQPQSRRPTAQPRWSFPGSHL